MEEQKRRTKGRLQRTKKKPQEVRESSDAFFRRLDKRVLELSSEVGSDNTEPHEISFWMYLPTEEKAYDLAKQLQAQKFEVEVSPPLEPYKDWLCLAYRTMVPDLDELEKIRKHLTKLVKQRDGRYDGWEMEVKG